MTALNKLWPMLWLAVTVLCLSPVSGLAPAEEGSTARPAPQGWALEGEPDDGRIIYKQYCQKCHGKRGDGNGTMAADLDPKPRDFTDAEIMGARSDWEIYLGIKEGGGPVGLSDEMTAWEDTLTEQEMRDVAAYVRQFAQPEE